MFLYAAPLSQFAKSSRGVVSQPSGRPSVPKRSGNPPFNVSDWGGERRKSDVRWKFGVPPASNANFAWMQHMVHHLAPHGLAGFVLANGSLSSNQSGEGDIRAEMIRRDIVDCVVSLPGQLFYTTQIPVCLWFLARDKSNGILKDKSSTLKGPRRRRTRVERVCVTETRRTSGSVTTFFCAY